MNKIFNIWEYQGQKCKTNMVRTLMSKDTETLMNIIFDNENENIFFYHNVQI